MGHEQTELERDVIRREHFLAGHQDRSFAEVHRIHRPAKTLLDMAARWHHTQEAAMTIKQARLRFVDNKLVMETTATGGTVHVLKKIFHVRVHLGFLFCN